MVLFATPDFGASGVIVLFLLVVVAAVLAAVVAGLAWGARLLKKESPRARGWGAVLLLVSGSVPLCCCLAPPHVVRIIYGNYPIGSYPNNRIREGMTGEEVLSILGSPHESYKQGDGERWYYWIDSFGISWFGVAFGPEGRVVSTYGD